MISIDYILDQDGDILEGEDFDFVEGSSDDQHIQDILQFEPGELKYDVLTGVGIRRNVNGSVIDGNLRKIITMQLEADNYKVKQLNITEKEIDIHAERIG